MATTAKRSRCSNSPCGTYDRNGIRFLCGQCIREHLGPQLPSFAERLERFAAAAAEAARSCSPASPSTFSSTSTVTAETEEEKERGAMASAEVDGPRRLAALGDAHRALSDRSVAPHLRRRRRPVERDS